MDLIYIAAALTSAFLHAAWNAAVKARPDPSAVMTAQMAVAAILVLPIMAWTGPPAIAAWPWIAASTALNVVTISALLRAYEVAGFGVAYPMARALSVMLVVPLSATLAGERMSGFGFAGVGLVVAALATLALSGTGRARLPTTALLWIAASGVTTAAYVMCDANGVRQAGSPLAYGCAVSLTNAIAMTAWRGFGGAGIAAIRARWAEATPIAVASIVSYFLILWVWTLAPIAPAAALRDMSALFAVAIAVIWLREPISATRLAAMALAAAAVPLLRLA